MPDTAVAVNTNTSPHRHCRHLDRDGEDQRQPALSLCLLSRSPWFGDGVVGGGWCRVREREEEESITKQFLTEF